MTKFSSVLLKQQ